TKSEIGTSLVWNYSFDAANQLTKIERRTNGTDVDLQLSFVYDVFGNRIAEVIDTDGVGEDEATVTRFALDGWNPVKPSRVGNENWDVWADLDGENALATRYLRGDLVDELFSRVEKDGASFTPFWLLTNNQNSICDVTDGDGDVVKTVGYGAFGNIGSETGAGHLGRFGWTGREIVGAGVVDAGLNYNRRRFFDVGLQRWISPDPILFKAGQSNLYLYAGNYPTNATDPSGL